LPVWVRKTAPDLNWLKPGRYYTKGGHEQMGRREESVRRTEQRVRDLIEGFDDCCDAFDRANLFTGPSLYFHFKTLELLRKHESPAEALRDEPFLESLYATLTAWGLHRMGPGGAKLVDFPVMVESFGELERQIASLSSLAVWRLGSDQVETVGGRIWDVISALRVGSGETRIVSGSKALHHLLPELVPPIDREYTLRFFFNNKSLYQGDRAAFHEMFPYFHLVAIQCRDKIERRIGHGMNTSPTKVIDNAVVGFVRTRLKPDSPG
jgi:hypothetical protein